jgi:hypothetical protein
MHKAKNTPRQIPRISLTPDEAAQSTGFSRTRIFQAIRDQKLLARGDGKATIIEVEELARWVRSLPPKGCARKIETVDTACSPNKAANAYELGLLGDGDGESE